MEGGDVWVACYPPLSISVIGITEDIAINGVIEAYNSHNVVDYKAHWEIARIQLFNQNKEVERLKKGIEWWLNKRMKNYTDNQYGIREMKQLLKPEKTQ